MELCVFLGKTNFVFNHNIFELRWGTVTGAPIFAKKNVSCAEQSVVNNFSDEQIRIWILFAKDILYEYEYEYYSWHLGSRIWIRILFVRNIQEYIRIFNIFEYLKKTKS